MKITRIFTRLLLATISIFIFNSFSGITQITLSLNIFNIVMISVFDIFGFILCVVLNIVL
ncbi:pro-sigmaK processing inhibitor BofA family protein [Allocoprobacillus halotolerans]|uniref:Pro-sigmaK processing inhibitor BofA family protein n=1 Tax=Allocoprobacillus halotolerans TaxID=2944914 RepID=A0ABY5I510_9FIRM|nr:pro-sigmaK processing inhibitor BofA family protein [Allocoprobacillus halotolerans]UTY40452.1 pro-sigmaK processing inhibitor BofA family protein [Allocoprobacillus halotolerans]